MPPATEGASLNGRSRCPYIVFAYASNLGESNWAAKEYDRILTAAGHAKANPDAVDQVIVLDRGIIRPQTAIVLLKENTSGVFLEFYLQLINFLTRERKRREPIDWTAYTSKATWTHLTSKPLRSQ